MTQTAIAAPALPWGTTDEGEFTRGGTILASVMGTCAVLTFLPLGVAGIVVSCCGLDRIRRRDPSANRWMVASWIMFVPGTVVGVPLALLLLASLARSALT
jgi:hypothetical protein